jgi:hypothetical protein
MITGFNKAILKNISLHIEMGWKIRGELREHWLEISRYLKPFNTIHIPDPH